MPSGTLTKKGHSVEINVKHEEKTVEETMVKLENDISVKVED